MSRPILPNGTPQRHASTPQAPGLLPATIYARVSTTEQADKGYSLPTQIMEEKQRALEALNISVVWHPDKPLEI